MHIKMRSVAILELVIIIALLTVIAFMASNEGVKGTTVKYDLLSKRVRLDPSEQKSFIIVNFMPLKQKLEEYVSKNDIPTAVYVENFRNGAFMGINEREGFVPASLNKLPLAIIVMRKVESGELSMDSMLKIGNSDRSDTSGILYQTPQTELPLSEVMRALLQDSDNTAFNVLLHYVKTQDIDFALDYYGLDLNLDFPEYVTKNHTNHISPKSMSNLFSSLYFSTVLSPEHSSYLLSLMENTAFDIKHFAKLPNETRVVHKFGDREVNDSTRVFHDCGILYIQDSRIFYCIMTSSGDVEEALKHTSIMINAIHEYVRLSKERYEYYQK